MVAHLFFGVGKCQHPSRLSGRRRIDQQKSFSSSLFAIDHTRFHSRSPHAQSPLYHRYYTSACHYRMCALSSSSSHTNKIRKSTRNPNRAFHQQESMGTNRNHCLDLCRRTTHLGQKKKSSSLHTRKQYRTVLNFRQRWNPPKKWKETTTPPKMDSKSI